MRFDQKAFTKDVLFFRKKLAVRKVSIMTTTGMVRLEIPTGLRPASERIGISAATLSRISNGKPPDIHTFAKLCGWMNEEPSKYFKP